MKCRFLCIDILDLFLYGVYYIILFYFYIFFFFFIIFLFFFFFFFSSRRRHTRYIGDWSSDVCSSDLMLNPQLLHLCCWVLLKLHLEYKVGYLQHRSRKQQKCSALLPFREKQIKIGRASCRERVKIAEGDGELERKMENEEEKKNNRMS